MERSLSEFILGFEHEVVELFLYFVLGGLLDYGEVRPEVVQLFTHGFII